MSMTNGFFDSSDSDRVYDSSDFRKLIKLLTTNGIDYGDDGSGFEVVARSPNAMSVAVASGGAIINGGWIKITTTTNLSIATSSTTYGRYDAVVIEFDSSDDSRVIQLEVITGTASGTPTYPTLTQTDTIYQLPLAYVYVGANVSSISDSNITDAREDWLSTNYIEYIKTAWFATTTTLGAIIVGDTLNITDEGVLNANIATSSDVGVVRAGDTMSVTDEGVLDTNTASADSLGVIKVGDGLRIYSDGTLATRSSSSSSSSTDLTELYQQIATGSLVVDSYLTIDEDDSHLLINDDEDYLSFQQTVLFNFA